MHKLYHSKKSAYWESEINENSRDSSKLWGISSYILQSNVSSSVPKVLGAQVISDYFVGKISDLRSGFPDSFTAEYPSRTCSNLTCFDPVTSNYISNLIGTCPNKTCSLDPYQPG